MTTIILIFVIFVISVISVIIGFLVESYRYRKNKNYHNKARYKSIMAIQRHSDNKYTVFLEDGSVFHVNKIYYGLNPRTIRWRSGYVNSNNMYVLQEFTVTPGNEIKDKTLNLWTFEVEDIEVCVI